jgi:hypothetical protein
MTRTGASTQLDGVMTTLADVAATIRDLLAVDTGDGMRSLHLGAASHSVHTALILVDEARADHLVAQAGAATPDTPHDWGG